VRAFATKSPLVLALFVAAGEEWRLQ